MHAHAGQPPAARAPAGRARLRAGAVRQRAREDVQHGAALAGRRAAQRVKERALLLGRPGAGLPRPARRAVACRGARQPCGWVPSRSAPLRSSPSRRWRRRRRQALDRQPVQPERGRSPRPRRPCPARGRAARTEATGTGATGGLAVGPVVDAQWARRQGPRSASCESRACTVVCVHPPPGGVRAPRQPPQGSKAANARVLHGAERLVTGPKTDPHSQRVEPQGHP